MANIIQVKRSAIPAKVPLTGDLALGELGINTYEGKLYLKKDNGTASIIEVGGGGAGTVTSVAASVPSLLSISGSPITTSGTLAITYSGTALPVLNGGTGQTTANNAFNGLAPSQAANNGKFLTTNGTDTSWATVSGGAGTVTSVAATVPSFLTISGSPITSAGTFAITYSGTALPIANGGNGLTATPTNGQLDIGNGSGFTRTTLTAGTNITITNSAGAITIDASGGGGGGGSSIAYALIFGG